MTQTPDALPGDVEAGADSGPDETRSSEPQNPIRAAAGDEAASEDDRPAVAQGPADASERVEDEQIDVATRDAVPDYIPIEDPVIGELRAELDALTQTLATAQRRADELATVARMQTAMADELHADNRRLRDGEIREATAPLVRGLARLADDLSRMRAGGESDDLAYLDGQVQELLHDAGVLAVQAEIGEPFDPQRHSATGSATTADSALNRTIAEVRRMGLRRDDGRMLRPVDVVVFRYVPPPPPLEPEGEPATEEVP